jgi:hypothetical protein
MSHDMALGYYLVAVAQMGDEERTVRAADQLLDTMHKQSVNFPGWGLGYAYDAFGDGTTNDAGTVYGITNAIVVRGLFDAFDLTGDVKYKNAALQALNYYYDRSFVESSTTNRGLFWYSNQNHDFTYGVMNVIAMLMGQYARAYDYTGNLDYKNAATRSARYLLYHKKSNANGDYWDYKYGDGAYSGVNDPVHAAFIVQGFIDYKKYLTSIYNPTPAINYIEHQSTTMTSGLERLWGVGQMIFTLTEAGRLAAADDVIDNVLPRFAEGNGVYAWATNSNTPYVRHTAYLLAGLARREAETP